VRETPVRWTYRQRPGRCVDSGGVGRRTDLKTKIEGRGGGDGAAAKTRVAAVRRENKLRVQKYSYFSCVKLKTFFM
jgi:hypothetical protein